MDESADTLAIEVADLRSTRAGATGVPLTLLERRLSSRVRARRLAVGGGTLLFGLVVIAASNFSLGDSLLRLVAGLAPASAGAPLTAPSPNPIPLATWQRLGKRALLLPAVAPGAPCPTSPAHHISASLGMVLGSGPVFITAQGITHGELLALSSGSFGNGQSSWGGQRVIWVTGRLFRGPVLVRGRQLDGRGTIGFNGGLGQSDDAQDWANTPPLPELQLVAGSGPAARPSWVSFVRLQTAGCYAFQIDGGDFSETIVFEAVLER
jgi:hypothetical protein